MPRVYVSVSLRVCLSVGSVSLSFGVERVSNLGWRRIANRCLSFCSIVVLALLQSSHNVGNALDITL